MQLIWSTTMLVDKSWNWSPHPKRNGSLQALGLRRPGWAPSFAVWWWSAHTSKEVANRLWLVNCGSCWCIHHRHHTFLHFLSGDRQGMHGRFANDSLVPVALAEKQASASSAHSQWGTAFTQFHTSQLWFSSLLRQAPLTDTYKLYQLCCFPCCPLATRLTHLAWCVR